jgi:uncharacterized protein DUF6088
MRSYSITAKILRRMRASTGAVFSAKDFLDLGSRDAIDQALVRATRRGKIRRVGRGLYDVPRKGILVAVRAPSADAIANAVARKSSARIAPTGARAANVLGLSTQVPAQARYITDRSTKKIRVGTQTIHFSQVAPRRLAGASASRTVIEALRHIGSDELTAADIDRIRDSLSDDNKRALRSDLRHAPDWMRPLLKAIVDDVQVRTRTTKASHVRRG